MPASYLPGLHPRARWMRLDAAALLKRFFFLEQSLVVSQAGWLPAIPLLLRRGAPSPPTVREV